MTSIPFRPLLLAAAGVAVLAGCGNNAANKTGSTASTTAPATNSTAGAPTPTPAPIPPTPVITGSIAGTVNGNTIPLSAYRLLLNLAVRSSAPHTALATLVTQTKNELIYNELIQEYANAHHITLTNAELDAQQKQDEKQNGGAAAFSHLLSSRYGLTLAQYRQLVRPNLLGTKVEHAVVPAKPAHTDAQAKALANTILRELKNGANFATLAHKYSDDPGSAAQGGDLGAIYPGQTVAPFDHAAFHAPLNTYVIVHSQFGYHVVEVLSRAITTPPAQAGQPKPKPTLTAHVRHILISTQPPTAQAQSTSFLTWLKAREKASTITWVAKVKS